MALPFAVLEAGGSISAVGLVVAAQLVPFLVFALVGGVIADRGDRRRVLVASDVARLVVQAVGGVLLVADAASPLDARGPRRALRQRRRVLPAGLHRPAAADGVAPRPAAAGQRAARAELLGGEHRRPAIAGCSSPPSAPARRCSSTPLVRGERGLPAAPAPAVAEEGIEAAPPAFVAAVKAGWREVRSRSWLLAGLGAGCAYAGIVLPAVFVLGPVSISERLGGPRRGRPRRLLRAGLRAGRRAAAALPPALRDAHGRIALILASSQAAIYGSGVVLGSCARCSSSPASA